MPGVNAPSSAGSFFCCRDELAGSWRIHLFQVATPEMLPSFHEAVLTAAGEPKRSGRFANVRRPRSVTGIASALPHPLLQETADACGDFAGVRFEREVPGIKELNDCTRNIAFERFGTGGHEEWIVLTPHCQK